MSVKNPTSHQQGSLAVTIKDFTFESGDHIDELVLAYERHGPVDAPVLLICHALTGNQFAIGSEQDPGWWAGLVGEGNTIDTNQYQVITFNVLGGCHGSSGPASTEPKSGEAYRLNFPHVSIRDMVHAQYRALQLLGIHHVKAVAGGSLGGMQAFEWGLLYPSFMDKLFILAATPYLSDYGIAFNHIGARAIKNDPSFNQGHYETNTDLQGFEIARMAGMVTYRSSKLFQKRFDRSKQNSSSFDIQSYLDYQGDKIKQRFDANSYLYLLEAMNHHDIGRGREGWKEAAKHYQADLYTISFEHDLLYPQQLMNSFSKAAPNCEHYHVDTDYGHDGFLVEFEDWGAWMKEKLEVKKS